jgi:hypothetical protein
MREETLPERIRCHSYFIFHHVISVHETFVPLIRVWKFERCKLRV